MQELKHRLFSNWTNVRLIYNLLGLLILGSSIPETEWIGILFGAYVSSMGIFAFGCAGGQCIPMKDNDQNSDSNELEIQFEEITIPKN